MLNTPAIGLFRKSEDNQLVQPELFNAIIPYITRIDSDGYIEVTVPDALNLDYEVMRHYFIGNLTWNRAPIVWHREVVGFQPTIITGTIKDKVVVDYLLNKMNELSTSDRVI